MPRLDKQHRGGVLPLGKKAKMPAPAKKQPRQIDKRPIQPSRRIRDKPDEPEREKIPAMVIVKAYPGFKYLDITPPSSSESVDSYRQCLEKPGPDGSELDNCGDSLFAFILRELSDAENLDEASEMLITARDDLVAVRTALDNYAEEDEEYRETEEDDD